MDNVTAIKILKPADEVFEAFVDPSKIGHFWFSSSSERWAQRKMIHLTYEEYAAHLDIRIIHIEANKKIRFQWGANGEGHIVTISLTGTENTNTIVEVREEGFDEEDEDFILQLLDNKEGWVYMLTCLKGYLEFGISQLRAGLVKN